MCYLRVLWILGLQDLSKICVRNQLIFQRNPQKFQYLQDMLGSDLFFFFFFILFFSFGVSLMLFSVIFNDTVLPEIIFGG